ncbi:hypothetical protein CSAL01_09898 [Colletotrichum salicis]|uniref:Uncharacterized protein n=1 Tax=Colletotrichum salicis TaxID=1209931 RepID=A0A135T3D9_9PEZI|nr:hypothetical protein CSAL01_09898 [Colletotrichum salicis]
MRTQHVPGLEYKKITSSSESWPSGDVLVVADAAALGNAFVVDADVLHVLDLKPRRITSSRFSFELNAVVLVSDTISINWVSVVCGPWSVMHADMRLQWGAPPDGWCLRWDGQRSSDHVSHALLGQRNTPIHAVSGRTITHRAFM